MNESFLVTGATGFVGSCITRRLVELGKTVHVISRRKKTNWRLIDIQKKIHYHQIDLLDSSLSTLLSDIKPAYVFHLAAYGALPQEDTIEKIYINNILGTVNLIRSLNFKKVKLFINTSSSAEYGTQKRALKETDPLQPMNDYAVSKVAQTLYVQKEAIRNNLPLITFRLFSVYGYYEEKNRLIPHAILHALKRKPIPLANPDFVRDFIFIDDVINAYMLACKQDIPYGGVFNIGSGKQYSVGDVVKEIITATGSTSPQLWSKIGQQTRQIEPKNWQADITKAQKMLHWKPESSLERGMKKTISWFKDNQNLYA